MIITLLNCSMCCRNECIVSPIHLIQFPSLTCSQKRVWFRRTSRGVDSKHGPYRETRRRLPAQISIRCLGRLPLLPGDMIQSSSAEVRGEEGKSCSQMKAQIRVWSSSQVMPIKGIVHPKLKSVIIYSPSSISKPVWMCLFCRTQSKIFWRKFVTRLFWGTIDFHNRKQNTMEFNGAPEYLPLCSAEHKVYLKYTCRTNTHTGLELLE